MAARRPAEAPPPEPPSRRAAAAAAGRRPPQPPAARRTRAARHRRRPPRRRPSRRRRRAAAPAPPPPPPAPAPPAAAPAPPPPPTTLGSTRRRAARRRRSPRSPSPRRSSLRLPDGDRGHGRDAALGVEPGRPRARAGAGAQPERDRRQLRPAVRRAAGRLVVDLPRHRVPGAVRLRRHVRAGGRDPPAPAAHARGRGADLGPRRSSAHSKALRHGGRRRAARARDPAVRGVRDQGRARAHVGPPQGRLRRRGRQQGQRAGDRRARRRRTRTASCSSASRPRRSRSRPGQTVRVDDARPPAEADLDRPPGRSGGSRSSRTPARRPTTGRRPRTCEPPDRAPRARSDEGVGHAGAARWASRRCRAAVCKRGPRRSCRSARSGVRMQGPRSPSPRPQCRSSTQRRPAEAARRRGGGAPRRRPAAAHPGRLPPEGVAAVVGRACWSRCCSLLALLLFLFLPQATSPCPTSSARSRRSRPRRSSPRPSSSSPRSPSRRSPRTPAPGTVIGQTPTAGEKAEKGSAGHDR